MDLAGRSRAVRQSCHFRFYWRCDFPVTVIRPG
jgi:hypothetical protein